MRYLAEFATTAAACIIIVTTALGTVAQRWELIASAVAAGTWAILCVLYQEANRR